MIKGARAQPKVYTDMHMDVIGVTGGFGMGLQPSIALVRGLVPPWITSVCKRKPLMPSSCRSQDPRYVQSGLVSLIPGAAPAFAAALTLSVVAVLEQRASCPG